MNSYYFFVIIMMYCFEVEFQIFSVDEWSVQNLYYKVNDLVRVLFFVVLY